MTLELQTYLRSHSVEELKEEFGIKVRQHADFNNLYLFKYIQHVSDLSIKLVQQCRGIILDQNNNWNTVAYPYDKFFNWGEDRAAKLDLSSTYVQNKADGSMMTFYFYRGHWQVATSGMPDARGPVSSLDTMTFEELFWNVFWTESNYKKPGVEWKDYTFIFELETPWNSQVVKQEKFKLTLHGVRHNLTCKEEIAENVAKELGWDYVSSWPLGLEDLETVSKKCNLVSARESEGYIAVDKYFNRVKFKSEEYVKLSHLFSSLSPRGILKVILDGEEDEVLSYFPHMEKYFKPIVTKVNKLVIDIENSLTKLENVTDPKEFALAVKDKPYKGLMFSLKKKHYAYTRDALKSTNLKSLENLLGIKTTEEKTND